MIRNLFKRYFPLLLVAPSLYFGISAAFFPPISSLFGLVAEVDGSIGNVIISVGLIVVSWISFFVSNGQKVSHIITILSFSVNLLIVYCNLYAGIVTTVLTFVVLLFEKNKKIKIVAIVLLFLIVIGYCALVFMVDTLGNIISIQDDSVIKDRIVSPTGAYSLVEIQYKKGNDYLLELYIENNWELKLLFYTVRLEDKTILDYWTYDPSDFNKTIGWASDTEILFDGEAFNNNTDQYYVKHSSDYIIYYD